MFMFVVLCGAAAGGKTSFPFGKLGRASVIPSILVTASSPRESNDTPSDNLRRPAADSS